MSLVKFKLNRDYVLVTREGPSFRFVKGQTTNIPLKYVKDVIAIGAEAVDEDQAVADQARADTAREAASDVERIARIKEVIIRMTERNNSGDFTAGGRPNKKRVETLVGSQVSEDEIAVAFAEAKAGLQ